MEVIPQIAKQKKIILLLSILVVLLLIIILCLLYFLLREKPITNTGSVGTQTGVTPTSISTTVITTEAITSPTVSPTTDPYADWKDFDITITVPLSEESRTFTGKVPANTEITTTSDSSGFKLKNAKYEVNAFLPPEGFTVTYTSYKYLFKHSQFGNVYRVRYETAGTSADYISGKVTATGNCNSPVFGDLIAPCGPDALISADTGVRFTCKASLADRDLICDHIVELMQVKK